MQYYVKLSKNSGCGPFKSARAAHHWARGNLTWYTVVDENNQEVADNATEN